MLFHRLVRRIVDERISEARENILATVDERIAESNKALLEKVDVTLKENIASLETQLNERLTQLDKRVLNVKELRDLTSKELHIFKSTAKEIATKISDLLK